MVDQRRKCYRKGNKWDEIESKLPTTVREQLSQRRSRFPRSRHVYEKCLKWARGTGTGAEMREAKRLPIFRRVYR